MKISVTIQKKKDLYNLADNVDAIYRYFQNMPQEEKNKINRGTGVNSVDVLGDVSDTLKEISFVYKRAIDEVLDSVEMDDPMEIGL